jgi:serine/threonine protein kinase
MRPVSQPLRLAAGRIFAGDFKVVRPLKVGGQGSLYVVEQLSTSKQRALKLMLPELVAQPNARKRFDLEARIAARIPSDHVVEIIASGVDAATCTPWLVMELLEGLDLGAYTQKKKRLPSDEVLEIFSQLCHALGEAHRQGIVHRDLKPENIFLSAPRRRGVPFMVKVLDFGIARILEESPTISGGTGGGVGTPMWMSPEQAVPGSPVGPGTDVWPLGLLAFRMLTGYLFWKAPYDPGASVMMLMAEAFLHPLPTASERADQYNCRERLPPGFDEWFSRCVARPIEERFADASAAFGALEPLLVTFSTEDLDSMAATVPSAPALPPLVDEGDLASGHDEGLPHPPRPVSVPPPAAGDGGIPAPGQALLPAVDDGGIPPAPGPTQPPPGPPGVDAERASAKAEGRPEATGPGLKTWEGVPELANDLLRSDADSAPDAPANMGDTPIPPGVSRSSLAERVTALLAGKSMRSLVVSATLAGVVLGAAFVGWQRSRRAAGDGEHAREAASAPLVAASEGSATASASTFVPAAAASPPIASTPAVLDTVAEPPTAAPSSTAAPHGGHAAGRPLRLCKSAGAKCFGNDDCCDRSCKKWVCQANPALHDPYGQEGN